jgi:hypothetical protein
MRHLSDAELLALQENASHDSHLSACAHCRERSAELAAALDAFSETQNGVPLPDKAISRARLLHSMTLQQQPRTFEWSHLGAAACLILGIGLAFAVWPARKSPSRAIPDPRLTPGVTIAASLGEVCNVPSPKNKAVPAALERRVFEEYGIGSPRGRVYEVDYLITPALGGADDIRNLWPQPYGQTVWNAQVKDMLEDYLHDMVCDGRLDLATAQREIAGNWIEAYKKYFHTEHPLQ